MIRTLCWLLFLTSFAIPTSALASSPQEMAAEEESTVAKYMRLAREGRPIVRPQAARRLLEIPNEAIQALLAACGENGEGVAALGKDLVAVLGEFDDRQLRAYLWTSIQERDFPWRPSAARSLAKTALASEAESFDALLQDPIGKVRVAAIDALRALDRRTSEPRLQAALADPNDKVRRRAAALLADWGDPCALYWLVEDLGREDRFFALRTGKLARYEAFSLLKERLASTHDYSTRKSPTDPANVAAVQAIRAEIQILCETTPDLPAVALAGKSSAGNVLGLELRSCRRGEFFLRWNIEDVLLVGTGNSARIALPAGSVKKLLAAATKLFTSLDGQFWGEPGCDIEQFHFQPDAETRPRAFRVNKGQTAVKDLRPKALSELAALLCASIPDETSTDPRIDHLASRVTEALKRLGGEFPDPRIESR